MVEYRIGCSGWSYQGWVGPFYPPRTNQRDFLRLYSKVFDSVEIDSTFYSIPSASSVEKWFDSTPDSFLFCPKIPREITHENRLANADVLLEKFVERLRVLGPKIGMILIQLPPSLTYDEGFGSLKEFAGVLPEEFKFAIEFRHGSWFREDVFSTLESRHITLSWAETPYTKTPHVLTTEEVYLRLVGDRTIREEDFGHIQKDRVTEISGWADSLVKRKDDIKRAYVYSNNHFQGFAPGTVNILRKKLGLPELSFRSMSEPDAGQKTLF